MSQIIGVPDGKGTSKYLKIFIQEPESGLTVVGKIGDGTNLNIISQLVSPFEDDSVGASMGKASGGYQMATGATFKTALSTRQVWEGNQPYSFNVVLKLKAEHDAKKEVMEPIKAIEKMMAPDVNAVMPGFGGREPNHVILTIGNRIMKDMVISNASIPQDQLRTRDGDMVKAEITLTMESIQMITKRDLES